MASRFERMKAWLEGLVFTGLKPDVPEPSKSKSKLESLMESAEGLAGRGMKSEEKPLPGPVTLTKKLGIVLGILVIGVSIYFLVTILQHPAEQAEKTGPPPKPIEIVPKGFKVEKNKDLEIVEIEFDKNKRPKEIVGTLRNRTDRTFSKCEISFDVTTRSGEQLGGANTTVNNLAGHQSVKFKIPVPYENAGFVLVRELHSE